MGEARHNSILAGARVLDLTDPSGVFCPKLLAASGADVVIVEKPSGSPMRLLGPFYKDEIDREKSLHWFTFNLNKRSITLDLEQAEGQRLFKQLVKTADFVVECFPPGYLDRLGLGYQDLSTINPGIILTSITPFGQTGPYKDYQACDLVAQAMGGLMYQSGDEDTPPVQASNPVAYAQAAAQAAAGSMMAYYYKLMNGEGQHVDVSVQACVMWAQKPSNLFLKAEGTIVRRGGDYPIMPGWPRMRTYYRCRNGWIAAMATYWSHRGHLREWLKDEGLAEGLYDKEHDGYFEGEGGFAPPAGIDELVMSRFEQVAAKYDKEYLYKEGQRRGMQVTPVNTAKELLADEQLLARDFFIQVEHPELGDRITYPGAPFVMSESPWHLDSRAPFLGEHNEEIYGQELGLSNQELAMLKKAGVI